MKRKKEDLNKVEKKYLKKISTPRLTSANKMRIMILALVKNKC